MVTRDMVARHSDAKETNDFIPTPPYATRVLFEEVAPWLQCGNGEEMLDPACGEGHMYEVFREYGYSPHGMDLHAYGGRKAGIDFTKWSKNPAFRKFDHIVTNPPYSKLIPFIQEGLNASTKTLAILVRVQALESQKRYEIFSKVPPTQIGFFSDRIPFKVGEVVRKAPKMFFHVWVVWDRTGILQPRPPMWVNPNAQTMYEKLEDYK